MWNKQKPAPPPVTPMLTMEVRVANLYEWGPDQDVYSVHISKELPISPELVTLMYEDLRRKAGLIR